MTSIAFAGLGAMGRPMAANLIKAGHQVRGFDLNPAALDWLEGQGGSPFPSAREAASGADLLVLMVVNADQAEAVLFEAGALDALNPRALVILCATCPPARAAAIAAKVEASQRRFIDAPVSGGVVGAEAGSLTIMAAGPRADFEVAAPVLKAMGSRIYHVGQKAGDGAMVKTINQLLCGVHIAAAAEALALGERAGLDTGLLLEIFGSSAAGSWMLNNRGPRMLMDDPPVTSAVDIFVKDLGIVLDAGHSTRAPLFLAAAAHQLFLAASGMGLGKADDALVIEAYRAMAPKPAKPPGT
ncbi:MAG: NAD(P)-dependent oxidoreductase [Phreatobacter sp.]